MIGRYYLKGLFLFLLVIATQGRRLQNVSEVDGKVCLTERLRESIASGAECTFEACEEASCLDRLATCEAMRDPMLVVLVSEASKTPVVLQSMDFEELITLTQDLTEDGQNMSYTYNYSVEGYSDYSWMVDSDTSLRAALAVAQKLPPGIFLELNAMRITDSPTLTPTADPTANPTADPTTPSPTPDDDSPNCRNSEQLMINPAETIVACRDPSQNTCESDFEIMCPVNFSLCGVEAYNNLKSSDWNVTPSHNLLGRAYCRDRRSGQSSPSSGAGHISMPTSQPTTTAMTHNYPNGGSLPNCPTSYGCNEKQYGALCCGIPPPPECRSGATMLMWSWNNSVIVCQDHNQDTCESDMDDICPLNYSLCSVEEYNERNDGWDEVAPELLLGRAYCRDNNNGNSNPSAGAGHVYLSINSPMSTDIAHSYVYGSTLEQCPTSYGCNEKQYAALCCDVPGGRSVSGGRRMEMVEVEGSEVQKKDEWTF